MADSKIKNMDEFAATIGISRPTLSKYFQNPSSVRQSTRVRIEEALDRYDYRPNIYATNQNRRLTKNIGIVVPYLADPFFSEIARYIENLVTQAGFRPILLSSQGSKVNEIANLDSLRSIKPAGVFIAPLGRISDHDAIKAFCDDVPTVLFDSNIEDVSDAFVGLNHEKSIALIVEYLCETGEPPAFFEMKTPTNPNAFKRRNAYLKIMDQLGFEPRLIQVEGSGWDFEEIGLQEGGRIIAQGDMGTNTILCSNDRLAIGLLAAAYAKGLRVGNKPECALRIAGHDDHPFARYTCPTLTTVSQDYSSIAQSSAQALFALIKGEKPAELRQTILFVGHLKIRASA